MKNSHRKDRLRRKWIKNTAPYESRKSSRRRAKADQRVKKFAQRLDGLGNTFVQEFIEKPKSHEQLIDKYYIPSHYPPRDVVTELASLGDNSSSRLPTILLALGIIYLLFLH